MRVSTGMIFESGVGSIQQRTSSLLRTQQQVSSGRRMLTPSDDPVAAARAMEVTQAKGINAQYVTAQNNAKSSLGVMDGQLSSTTDLLVRVRELTVQAGNAALSPSDRKSIAAELRARFDELVALANSTDGAGQYLFSGYQGSNKPFAGSVDSGVTYVGDDGQRTLRVSGSRNLSVSQSGNDVFMRIKNGNGTFVTGLPTERSVNFHSASIDAGDINDSTAWSGAPSNTELRFWVDSSGGNVATKGYAVASIPAPAIIAAGVNDTFDISVNGAAAVTVPLTISAAAGPFALGNIQADIDVALGAGVATASLDAGGKLVITANAPSTSTQASSITLTATAGFATEFANLFDTPSANSGVYSIPGQTFYDLVDTTTGNSLFTGAPSATGSGGSYTHPYTSAAPIVLASAGPAGTVAFDLGATVSVSGVPATGDVFDIERLNSGMKTSPATITHANATIDKGVVTDQVKWSSAGNSQNLEVRFSVDGTGTYYDLVDATSGTSLFATPQPFASVHGTLTGSADLSLGFTPIASPAVGANDILNLTIDGTPRSITIPPGPGVGGAYTFGQLQTQLQSQLASYGVTVAASGNNLVFSSNSVYGNSAVTVTTPASNGAVALLGGASVVGSALQYGNPTLINLKGAGFDFGASFTIAGNPADGDTFTLKGSTDATGNGYFVTAPKMVAASNMGSGILGAGEVIDPTKWDSPYNSRQLEVRFWTDPAEIAANPTVYYDLVDTETERSLFTDTSSTSGGSGNTYTHVFKSGDPVSFSGLADPYDDFGISVTIQGTPASGDVFSVGNSTTESLFSTLSNLIHAVESPVGPVGRTSNAGLHNSLGQALTNLSRIEDNILRVRADIGTRLSEVDDLANVSENINLQYESTLSGLQDLDYAKAITDLMRMQTELQAAQQSFMKISGLSLFNYL